MPHPPLVHLPGGLELTRGGIIKLGGLIEILITPHASGNENFAVRQQRRRVSGPRLQHRCGWSKTTGILGSQAGRVKGGCGDRESESTKHNEKEGPTMHERSPGR